MKNIGTLSIKVKGMRCPNCETVVERATGRLPGIESVKADYGAETLSIRYNRRAFKPAEVFGALERAGYPAEFVGRGLARRASWRKFAQILLSLAGIALIFYLGLWLEKTYRLPNLEERLGYGMIFVVGLLSGFHCIGMCGGLIVGYTLKRRTEGQIPAGSHLAYGLGKTLSYTAFGGLFGWLGGLVAFTPAMRGTAAILAGLFLALFGLNMLHLMPHRRIFGTRLSSCLSRLSDSGLAKSDRPFFIGCLNGLMLACGPLQAMYVMAAATGSPLEGAKILFLFGAGTLPLMLGFGFFAGLASRAATGAILKTSGALVFVLGLIMLNRGLILTGTGYDFASLLASASAKVESLAARDGEGVQIIRMTVDGRGYTPDRFVLKKGVKVKWIVEGAELNECNRKISVPALNLNFDVEPGERIVEFTPQENGIVAWSCWMGMIRGSFVVIDEIGRDDQDKAPDSKTPDFLNRAFEDASNGFKRLWQTFSSWYRGEADEGRR